jgi:ketosteroid isomerase-like protein
LEEFHEAGDQAVVVIRVRGTAKASGVPLDQRTGQIWTWRDGQLWRSVVYSNPADAFRAIGEEQL